ncbi:MAG: tetratricopeptide repeat protein [Nanoarchaeota archaeon]|nr:tetratricopeptide repeat protein [Nanoarchaeota archaeon]
MSKKALIQKISIFIICLMFISFSLQVKGFCEEKESFAVWENTLGKGDVNQLKSIIQTEEGNYLAGGWTDDKSAGGLDGWLLQFDPRGNLQWEKTFGDNLDDLIYDVIQTQDKGFLLAGWTEKQKGHTNAWILKLGEKGNLEWEKQYDLSKNDKIYSIIQSQSGDYIATGCSLQEEKENTDALVMRIDKDGTLKWSNLFGGEQYDRLYSIMENTAGNLFIVGYTESIGKGDADGWMIKLSKDGDKEWDKTFGGKADDRFYSIIQTDDKGYAMIGYTKSKGAGDADMWVLKFDENGNLQWDKTLQETDWGYGAQEDDRGYSIIQTKSGHYVVAGYTCSEGEGKADGRIMKLDQEGNVILNKEHGGKENECLSSIVESRDGHYIFAGYTQSKEVGKTNAWLLNLNEKSNFCLGEDLSIFSEKNLKSEVDFENYKIKIFRDLSSVIQIFQNSSLVFTMGGHVFSIKEIGNDITSDGEPNLVIEEWSGGNVMAYTNFILSLGEQLSPIYIFSGGELKDLNGDGKKEIVEYDESFVYWHACHACSPQLNLIYEFSDGNYHLSPNLMYKTLPNEDELKKMREVVHNESKKSGQAFIKSHNVSTLNSNCWSNGDVFIPPETWSYMLDLVYSGHPDEAFKFLDSVWPENKLGKNLFVRDFLEKLRYFKDDVRAYADPPISPASKTYVEGWEAYVKKDYQKAASSFKDLLNIKPGYEAAIYLLGWSYLETGRIDEAYHAFHEAIKLNDEYLYVYYHIGKRSIKEKEYEKAIEAFNQIVKTEYADDSVYYNLGYSYYNLEKYEEAIMAYKKAAEQLGSSDLKASIYVNIALCCYELEDYEQARDYLYRSVEMDEDYDYAHYLLGFILYVKYEDDEGAQQEYDYLLELDSPYAKKLKSLIQ